MIISATAKAFWGLKVGQKPDVIYYWQEKLDMQLNKQSIFL